MPIPLFARQARLIIGDTVYELADVSAHTAENVERDRVTADGGRTVGFTRGRITSRITIEAEVLPSEPNPNPPRVLVGRFGPYLNEDHPEYHRVFDAAANVGRTGPEPSIPLESDDELHERIVYTYQMAPLETARGEALDAIAAQFGLRREPATQPAKKHKKPQPPAAPEPRSVRGPPARGGGAGMRDLNADMAAMNGIVALACDAADHVVDSVQFPAHITENPKTLLREALYETIRSTATKLYVKARLGK